MCKGKLQTNAINFSVRTFFKHIKLKSPVIRMFSVSVSKARPIEFLTEFRVAGVELGGLYKVPMRTFLL